MSGTAERSALITGGCGFAGSHLTALLQAEGYRVMVFDLGEPAAPLEKDVDHVKGDIRSKEMVLEALGRSKPAVVFHLAGIAFVPAAERNKDKALSVNLMGGMNLFEAVSAVVPGARVVVASSAEVYGKIRPDEVPIREEQPVRPASFYAFTKAAMENAAQYAASTGLDVKVLRPFNHIGPLQPDLYVTSAFARQVAEAECGKVAPVVKAGNLESVRDFTDVEDMMRAYLLAGQHPLDSNLYNLASGRGVKIQDILDILLELARVKIGVEKDPLRLRPSDVPVLIGDSTRFSKETGWQPRISLRESLERILEYWRARIR